jgi:hypothetical protein
MTQTSQSRQQRIIKLVQELLLDIEDRSTVTPAKIEETIDRVLAMSPSWTENFARAVVLDELIRRFSVWMGEDTTLKSDANHEPWLNSSRKRDWRYWQRYREWLERKLSWKAVEALDRSTDLILSLLEDPERQGAWDRRGLIVGHVQSGKTGNYTGLICKAADAGYKIIVVLAGLHNNLRSQTQIRLDEGFLGYETKPIAEDLRPIGVGEIDGHQSIRPNYATNRTDAGDFNAVFARNLGITPETRPWLFVVKKNKSVLEQLNRWIDNQVATTRDNASGRKIVTHLPLLIIDDEADHASVDTGEQAFDGEGKPDEEHEPTAINRRIRRLLHAFARSAYVGYTATPFANIFIHEKGATQKEGPDLFPSAFIVNLAAPSNYVGPSRVFGLMTPEGREGGLPLIQTVSDHENKDGRSGWMPRAHRNGWIPLHEDKDVLPPDLIRAIDSFILACAARRLRGQEREHCSMLVHVTRFTSVQKEVYRQIDQHLGYVRQRIARKIGDVEVIERLRTLWERDFVPVSAQVRDAEPDQRLPPLASWDAVLTVLADTVGDIELRMINGTAKDALDYEERSETGFKVIAIGGDKLARGLTLEGLCTSYFLRSSRMYDTLMQMGRWFGYRPGYLDLMRLFTTADLVHWFGVIADASEELREEFDLMAARGATPREYGLRVKAHPGLLVTSPLKMRQAKDMMLSFSGELLETVVFHRSRKILSSNLNAGIQLIASLSGAPEINPERRGTLRSDGWQGYLWRGVQAERVTEFMHAYSTHPASLKVKSYLIAEFIESMKAKGELVSWNVALVGARGGEKHSLLEGVTIPMLERGADPDREDRYSIGRLLSPRDESIDIDDATWTAALRRTHAAWKPDAGRARSGNLKVPPSSPSGPAIRQVRGLGAPGVEPSRDTGLLLLYLLDPQKLLGGNKPLSDPDSPPVLAFGVSFPASESSVKVSYKANSVEWSSWEQEYASFD